MDKISPENGKLTCKYIFDKELWLIGWFGIGIDLHLPFFGRCDSMDENYRALQMKEDSDFKKLEFLSANAEIVPEEVLSALQGGPLSCKPRFIFYCEGEKKCEIDGADYS